MALRVIVDDLASISEPGGLAELTNNDNVEVSRLREPSDLQTLSANGFSVADDEPAAIVTRMLGSDRLPPARVESLTSGC